MPLIFPEGEDDEILIKKAFDGMVDVRLLDGGKPKSLELAAKIEDAGFKRSRVLVDRDFDELGGDVRNGTSVLIETTTHDVFMDVLLTAPRIAADVVRGVNKSRYRLMEDEEKAQHQASIIASALSATFNVTCLRILNARYGIGLVFDKFPFANYLKKQEQSLAAAVELVLHKSKALNGITVNVQEGTVYVRNESYNLKVETLDLLDELQGKEWLLVGDHDFLAVLSLLLDDGWGARKLRTLFEAEITSAEVLNCPWGIAISEFVENCP